MLRWLFALVLLLLSTVAQATSYSEEVGASLSTTASLATLDGAHTGIAPARKIKVGLIVCDLTSIAGGATSAVWYMSRDAAGDQLLTDKLTTTIDIGQTATKGSLVATMDEAFVTNSTALYLWIDLDAGTATATCRAYWEAT